MKFREQTAKKKSIRQSAGMFLAVTVLLAGRPYIAEAAEIVKDMDGTAYAQDAAGEGKTGGKKKELLGGCILFGRNH